MLLLYFKLSLCKFFTILIFTVGLIAQEEKDSFKPNHSFEKHRSKLHQISHVVIPTGIAYALKIENKWENTALIYLSTNLVDLDHLTAKPIYDPNRCSINYHPLHSDWAIFGYNLLALYPQTRDIGTGFLIHMGLDYIDCELMKNPKLTWENSVNLYTLSHFIFWYGMGKYSNLKRDEMFSISLSWEVTEFKLPYEFAREDWKNKTVDLISNYLGFRIGRAN